MTSRGDFLSAMTLGAASMATAVPRFPERLRRPMKLRRGDRAGLIAPASPPDPSEIDRAVANVESLGLEPVLGEYVHAQQGYLAGSDAERAADFNRMARDPSIRAIFSIRGGYGTMRILEALDYEALGRDPKVVMGYSDLTAVLNAVTARSGLVTFHGPVAAHGSLWSGEAREFLERILFSAEPVGRLHIADAHPIAPGRARGRLAGGNLSMIAALLGTPFAVAAEKTLLFFEETLEAPYRIDRMLTQLSLAGVLQAARGILIGQCTKCEGDGPSPPASLVIAERLRRIGHPVVAGAPIGHIATQWVIPIGVEGELDVEKGTLTLEEAAVRGR
jgi:muramoyltetrapeptide carboxypeptidase